MNFDSFEHPVVVKAYRYAADAHGSIDHRRKYTNEPYIVHPVEVASLVAVYFSDHEMISAALLHDVVEDTPRTLDDIKREFGINIATLVYELTDISKSEDGNRATRKLKDKEHIAKGSIRSHSIKLADLISNTKSIIEYDLDFARVYLEEKNALMEVLQDGHPELLEIARNSLMEGFLKLSQIGCT